MLKNTAAQFLSKKNLAFLALIFCIVLIFSPATYTIQWVGLYLTNCEIDKNDARKVGQWARIEAHIWTGWACGISGECSRYYQINPDEVWHFAELPPLLTVKQYQKNAAKISQKVKEIETARDQLAEFAKACGLLGYVEIVGTIQKTK